MSSVFDTGGYIGTSVTYPTVVPNIVSSGLVLHLDAGNTTSYPGTGTTWFDLSGNALNGTLTNTTFSSLNGGSFAFNGTSSVVAIPNSTSLDNQSFTIEVWVKTNNTSQNGFWFEKGTVNTQYSFFQESSNGRIYCRVYTTGVVDTITAVTASFMNTSTWYQCVFTFTSGAQKLYINKTDAGTGTTSGTIATNNGGMSIGAYGGFNGARGYYFNGNIAIERIYNRALTLAEITQNYNVHKTRFGLT